MTLPLTGTVVLDFGRVIAGPFAAQLLGDLGADVIKIEPLGGDETRGYVGRHRASPGSSSLFVAVNRAKRSFGVDLRKPEGVDLCRALAATADVLVHNFRPGVMEAISLDYVSLRSVNPRLVYASISGFGQGPLSGLPSNDLAMQAFSGLMSFSGHPDTDPVRCPVSIADYTTGFYGALGILAGLVQRERDGVGSLIETSLLESMLGLLGPRLADYLDDGIVPHPLGSANQLGQPNQAFRTADGWVVVSAVSDPMWQRCAAAVGGDALRDDTRFKLLVDRYRNRDELIGILSNLFSGMTTGEAITRLQAARVVCASVNSVADVAQHPHVRDLGMFSKVEIEGMAKSLVASPLTVSGDRLGVAATAPSLGEDTLDVLSSLGLSADEAEELANRSVVVIPRGPQE